MKILQVIPFFTPQMGGAAEVVYQLSAHLPQLGHQVTVVTTDYGWETSRFPDGEFELVVLPNLIAGFGFYLSPKLIGWANHNLKKFDIIHMQTLRTFQNAVIHHYCQKYRIPFILSAHGTLPIFMQRRLPKRAFDWIIGNKLIEDATFMHAVSQVEVEQYQQSGVPQKKINLIPNGLDLDITPNSLNKKHGSSKSQNHSKRILFIGRLHPIKSVDVLIKAFARLQDRHKYQLLIVGPDEGALSSLQTLSENLGIAQQVTFTGPLYGEQKADQYSQADLVVMPSSYEIFGLVPFEALLYEKPVIISEGTGAGCLIEKIGAGYLFPVNDEIALGETITHVFNHLDQAQQKVRQGQSYIKEHLSWSAIAREYEALYQGIR